MIIVEDDSRLKININPQINARKFINNVKIHKLVFSFFKIYVNLSLAKLLMINQIPSPIGIKVATELG